MLPWIVRGLALLVSARLHVEAGDVFPPVWSDESIFLWPAWAFAQRLTLFAPELDSQRELMIMPPAYSLVMAAVVKVFGLSIDVGRWASWTFGAVAYVLLSMAVARFTGLTGAQRFGSSVLLATFFLQREAIGMQNLGRMDTLLMLCLAAAFALLNTRRWKPAGAALLATSPLIHPNGTYFLATFAAGLGGMFLWRVAHFAGPLPRRAAEALGAIGFGWPPGRVAVVVTIGAMGAWGAYVVYVLTRLPWFLSDMAFQAKVKNHPAEILAQLTAPATLIIVPLCLLGLWVFRFRSWLPLIMALLPLEMVARVGTIAFYEVFDAAFRACALTVVYLAVTDLIKGRWPALAPRPAAMASGAVLLSIVSAGVLTGKVEVMPVRPLEWVEVRLPSNPVDYASRADRSAVAETLAKRLPADRPWRLRIFPEGDTVLFHQLLPPNITLWNPYFDSRQGDATLYHLSRSQPASINEQIRAEIRQVSDGRRAMIRCRDFTEVWYLVDRSRLLNLNDLVEDEACVTSFWGQYLNLRRDGPYPLSAIRLFDEQAMWPDGWIGPSARVTLTRQPESSVLHLNGQNPFDSTVNVTVNPGYHSAVQLDLPAGGFDVRVPLSDEVGCATCTVILSSPRWTISALTGEDPNDRRPRALWLQTIEFVR